MTPNKEDYLKAIYKLGGIKSLVSNKEISKALQVAPASVSEMVGKLSGEGLIEYERYKGSYLTEKGLKAALSLVKGHRLWEVFLIEHLGYSWSEAHEDAELLEHISSPRLVARLDKFLSYPTHCPHGHEIRVDGERNQLWPLVEVEVGESAYLRQVTEEADLLDYLQGLGIELGTKVTILAIGDYEGPLTLKINDREVQISYKAACQIFVE